MSHVPAAVARSIRIATGETREQRLAFHFPRDSRFYFHGRYKMAMAIRVTFGFPSVEAEVFNKVPIP